MVVSRTVALGGEHDRESDREWDHERDSADKERELLREQHRDRIQGGHPRAAAHGRGRGSRALRVLRGGLVLAIAAAAIVVALLALWRARPAHPMVLARRWLRWYLRQLHYLPLFSRAVSAGIIFFFADLSAQLLNATASPLGLRGFSFARLCRYSVYGFVIMGPFLYLWYSVMNEYGPEDDFRGALLKCLFEQFTLEPMCITMYICYDGLLCRRGTAATYNKLKTDLGPLWFKNAVFWLPANFSNYYIGTPDMRVLFANLCSLFWNIYFSIKVNAFRSASPMPATLPLYAPAGAQTSGSAHSQQQTRHSAQINAANPRPQVATSQMTFSHKQAQEHPSVKQQQSSQKHALQASSFRKPQPGPHRNQDQLYGHEPLQEHARSISSSEQPASLSNRANAARHRLPAIPVPALPLLPYEKSPPSVTSPGEFSPSRVAAL